MSGPLVLCGDIGGTKTLLAIGALDGDRLNVIFERRYADRDFAEFTDLVSAFRDEARTRIDGACLGVAGPVEGRRVAVTNFPWRIDADALEAILGAPVALANDFVAAAHGIDLLRPGDVVTLQAGEPKPRAPQVVIGAGTGLGVAYRVWQGDRYAVIGGEGGHAGFAPADERQVGLWRALHAELGRVGVEQIVSGPGLARIHDFLREGRGAALAPEEIASSADPVARAALDLFLECFGAEAGDHALAVLARGGVFLAGGIAPKILPQLRTGRFLAAFGAKGTHARVMARFPVRVVVNERLGLLGAAKLAAGL
ncbi:MAG TPA: glucokinase [Burkholderiales bacterium]|nr:glucokinase [Burkholderiales bacterium]